MRRRRSGSFIVAPELRYESSEMAGNLLGGLVFGAIGFVALAYGKRQARVKMLVIGAVLMVYPYFVANTPALYAIGILLTALLFVVRD